ncbi:MAG: RNA methyltransferase [Gammaproteobacteria bacterium]|nr:RNA methyltransferase [Gammaproteobacteria bacterium]MCP5458059.1 RNA methyltransferase [Gammaproteobacteria bacterium]
MNFNNVRIVLVEPSHPGNIGATARAMKTMGLQRLVLVNPAHFPHLEACARAAGALDVLDNAQIVNSFEAALIGCHWVFGCSARSRGVTATELDPRQAAAKIAEHSDLTEVALIFGRERCGLHNNETDQCNFLVHIPTNPAFASLNLAAAVQVLAYELRMQTHRAATTPSGNVLDLPAPADEMQRFYEHLEQVLLQLEFLNPSNPRHLMRRFRRLFNRAHPDRREINILRGILTAIQQKTDPPVGR